MDKLCSRYDVYIVGLIVLLKQVAHNRRCALPSRVVRDEHI